MLSPPSEHNPQYRLARMLILPTWTFLQRYVCVDLSLLRLPSLRLSAPRFHVLSYAHLIHGSCSLVRTCVSLFSLVVVVVLAEWKTLCFLFSLFSFSVCFSSPPPPALLSPGFSLSYLRVGSRTRVCRWPCAAPLVSPLSFARSLLPLCLSLFFASCIGCVVPYCTRDSGV